MLLRAGRSLPRLLHLFLVALSFGSPLLVPVNVAAAGIGRTVRLFEDANRSERLGPGGHRLIVASIYYPSTQAQGPGEQSVYIDMFRPAATEALRRLTGLGADAGRLTSTPLAARPDAPPARVKAPLPVVIFSPGFGVDRDLAQLVIEPLVGRGFVVVTVGHTWDTAFTVLPDGRVLGQTSRYETLPENDHEFWPELTRIRVEDLRCAIGRLRELNERDDLLRGMMDLERLGVAGHSIGGAAALDLAATGTQVRAGVVLDGLLDNRLARERARAGARASVPFLFVRSQATSAGEIRANLERSYGNRVSKAFPDGQAGLLRMAAEMHEAQGLMLSMMAGPRWFVKLQGTRHNAFNDLPLLFANPAPLQGDAELAFTRATVARLVSAFFAEHLSGKRCAFSMLLAPMSRGVCTLAPDGTVEECGPPPPSGGRDPARHP